MNLVTKDHEEIMDWINAIAKAADHLKEMRNELV
jgi:hypothetical protein